MQMWVMQVIQECLLWYSSLTCGIKFYSEVVATFVVGDGIINIQFCRHLVKMQLRFSGWN